VRPTAEAGQIVVFWAEACGSRYPAVVLRHNGADLFMWTWLDVPGRVIAATPRRETFLQVRGSHLAHHRDGRIHRKLEGEGATDEKAALGRREPASKIASYRAIFAMPIPFDELPSGRPETGPWKNPQSEIVLRAAEFHGAAGVNLNVFLAKEQGIEALLRRYAGKRSWLFHSKPLSLFVAAEPIFYPS
jgi:hypothetical protein